MTRRELRIQAKNVATENVGGVICDESRLVPAGSAFSNSSTE